MWFVREQIYTVILQWYDSVELIRQVEIQLNTVEAVLWTIMLALWRKKSASPKVIAISRYK